MKKIVAMILALAAAGSSAQAGTAWNNFSARLYGGVVQNGGTLDSKPGYQELDMGSEAVYGLALEMIMTDTFALKFDLSQFSNSASQKGTGPEYGADQLDVSLDVTTLSVTGKRRFSFCDGMIVPWLGAGVDVSVIETSEHEIVGTAGGPFSGKGTTEVSNGVGGHGSLGLDIYPVRQSALAFMVETRYTGYSSSGPFEGNLNGAMVLLGLKWDFGQR